MAIITTTIDQLPLHTTWQIPSYLTKANYYLSARFFYDDTILTSNPQILTAPIFMYFHGAGRADHYESTEALVSSMTEKGYVVVTPMYFESGSSTGSYENSGYGDVGAPYFYGRMIRGSRWVQSALEYFTNSLPFTGPIILGGQSMGAFSILAWSALSDTAEYSAYKDRIRGIFANGALSGSGLGGLKWEDIDRNLGHFNEFFQRVKHRTVASYATNDDFAPPDFVRRWQRMLPVDSPVYVVSPGVQTGGHGWLPNNTPIWNAWVDQLLTESPIFVNGTPAIKGPVVP